MNSFRQKISQKELKELTAKFACYFIRSSYADFNRGIIFYRKE